MCDALDKVIATVSKHSGIPLADLSAASAIDWDVRMSGDVTVQWPCQRFADVSEPGLFWRLVTWPFRGCLFDPSPFERLELGHIAAVIDRGEWFEP